MATQTPNLGLKKPAGSDYVLIGDFNDNSDIVDNATGKLSNLQTSEKTNLVAAINEARTTSNADHAPYIAPNGNWFVWEQETSQFVDSSISATGGTGGSVPTGGTTGKVLKKASDANYDTEWGDVQSLPAGGTTGQVLVKQSTTDFDCFWSMPYTNRNLLDNWDFTNPVNQRGLSSYDTSGYAIDRWKLISGTVTLTTDGLTLNGTISQILESAAGTDVTASVRMHSGTATITYDNATETVTISSSGGTVSAAKLEMGSVSTLANDPPMDFGTELTKCQRFYWTTGKPNFGAIGMAITSTTATSQGITIPVGVQMRTNPTVTFDALYITSGSISWEITAITSPRVVGTMIKAYGTVGTAPSNASSGVLRTSNASSHLTFSADL